MEPKQMSGPTGEPQAVDEDFVFRFALDRSPSPSEDPLADLIRTFVAGFLDIGCFTRCGRPVRVDGFRLNGRKGEFQLLEGCSGEVRRAPGRT
jgi:hypothetical protein